MLLIFVALLVFAADRVTKLLVEQHLPLDRPVSLIDGLVYLTHTQNTGAAFSLGRSYGTFYLVFALVASVVIVVVYRRLGPGQLVLRVAMGMILGGALGNAFDRLVSSSVTDFIDLRWWPVFNLADSCIVVGAVLIVLDQVFSRRHPAPE